MEVRGREGDERGMYGSHVEMHHSDGEAPSTVDVLLWRVSEEEVRDGARVVLDALELCCFLSEEFSTYLLRIIYTCLHIGREQLHTPILALHQSGKYLPHGPATHQFLFFLQAE